ncbi:MAG: hypothetical protein QG600_341 [Patescibacteria group bacterium]|nr:hypothetical protein [Patescibacteria group bacterium]
MRKSNNYSGQTLVLLLVFVVIAMLITTAVLTMTTINSGATDKVYQGTTALDIAESGAETAMIKIIRDPSYSGETVAIGNGEAVITVTGSNPKIITSKGDLNNFSRRVEVTVDFTNNIATVTSWKEIQ